MEKPGRDPAAAPPALGDIRKVELVLVVLAIAQRGGLGVDDVFLCADIGRLENPQSLGVGSHHAVFDPVVHHLDEMAAAARPAMQVALLGGSAGAFASWRSRNVAAARCEGRKDGVEMTNGIGLAADHHAVAALKPPDAAAGSDVAVGD